MTKYLCSFTKENGTKHMCTANSTICAFLDIENGIKYCCEPEERKKLNDMCLKSGNYVSLVKANQPV